MPSSSTGGESVRLLQYYASAMVMMARSVGLPAQLAEGFAPGERQEDETFLYRESNAHAWAEIYFLDTGGRSSRRRSRSSRASPGSWVTAPSFHAATRSRGSTRFDGEVLRERGEPERCSARRWKPVEGAVDPRNPSAAMDIRTRGPGTRSSSSSWPAPCSWCG